MHVGQVDVLLVSAKVNFLLDLGEIDVLDHGVVAVKDLCNLLQGGALGLDVEEPDEDELNGVPKSVEEHEVPVLGEVIPGDLVGLAGPMLVFCVAMRMRCQVQDLLSNGKDSLDGNVHNSHSLGTEMKGEDLEGVGNEQTGETNIVENTE